MPVARHSERAPAMLRPAVEVLERYWGILKSFRVYGAGDEGI